MIVCAHLGDQKNQQTLVNTEEVGFGYMCTNQDAEGVYNGVSKVMNNLPEYKHNITHKRGIQSDRLDKLADCLIEYNVITKIAHRGLSGYANLLLRRYKP